MYEVQSEGNIGYWDVYEVQIEFNIVYMDLCMRYRVKEMLSTKFCV